MRRRENIGPLRSFTRSMLALALGLYVGFYTRGVFFQYQQASRTIADLGITVTVSQDGRDRSLSVIDHDGNELDQKLMGDWGPALRANLYRMDAKTIAVMDFGGSFRISANPLAMKYDTPSKDWKYLGTFVRLQQELQFSPAGDLDECMDILMDEPPPKDGRENIYRRQC